MLFVLGGRAPDMYELMSRSWFRSGLSKGVSEFVAYIVVVGANPEKLY